MRGVEALDITDGIFYDMDNLSEGRAYTSAIELPGSSEILVLGGYGGDSTTLGGDRLLYDSTTGRFVVQPFSTGMVFPRFYHQNTLLVNGLVLMTGGVLLDNFGYFSLVEAEVYNPGFGTTAGTSGLLSGE